MENKVIEENNQELEKQSLLYDKVDELFVEEDNNIKESNLAMATTSPFTIRTTKPKTTDKNYKCYVAYYSSAKGWSGAIIGNPTDSVCNVLSNCVGYAQGRFCEIYNELTGYSGTNKYFYLNCDAKNFDVRARNSYPSLKMGSKPKPGAICVMDHTNPDYGGHVMVVEKVIDDNTILVSESAYGGTAFYTKTRSNSNGRWGMGSQYSFKTFIYNPAVEDPGSIVTPGVARDETKNQVKANSNTLRVRKEPSLSGEVLGFTTLGNYYNYYEIKSADGYDWYRIADKQWCAQAGSLEILPKSKEYRDPRIGDHVRISGSLYKTAIAEYASGYVGNKETYITRFAEGTAHPYNTTGDLGWMDKKDIILLDVDPEPIIVPSYKLTKAACEHGSFELSSYNAHSGDTITVEPAGEKGYKVSEVYANEELVENFSFTMPAKEVEVRVVFIPETYNIVCGETEHGKIWCSKDFAAMGEEIDVQYEAEPNYKIKSISSNQVVINNCKFTMAPETVYIAAEFEPIVQCNFKVGDKVKILARGNTKSDGSGELVFRVGEVQTVSNIVWEEQYTLAKYCIELSAWDGTKLGYYRQEDLSLNTPVVGKEFEIGETIKIISKGNTKSDGSGVTTFGIGWKKEVLDYIENAEYPYEIGRNGITQGYYKSIALKKV